MTVHEDILELLEKSDPARKRGIITLQPGKLWAIQSETDHMEYYLVANLSYMGWLCTCKGFRFTDDCKHLPQVKEHFGS